MLIAPTAASRPSPPRTRRNAAGQVSFTVDSDLGATILHMISTHSLAAFTPSVGLPGNAQPVRGVTPSAPKTGQDNTGQTQRTLDAVPQLPGRPMPRGSLLDLRV